MTQVLNPSNDRDALVIFLIVWQSLLPQKWQCWLKIEYIIMVSYYTNLLLFYAKTHYFQGHINTLFFVYEAYIAHVCLQLVVSMAKIILIF